MSEFDKFVPSTSFVPGDLVRLKSGSVRMTVLVVKDNNALVMWSDYDTKDLRKAEIPFIGLKSA